MLVKAFNEAEGLEADDKVELKRIGLVVAVCDNDSENPITSEQQCKDALGYFKAVYDGIKQSERGYKPWEPQQ